MDPSDFIQNELLPEMIEKGAIIGSINSIEISPISTDGTFMMTTCRKVKVNLKLPNGEEGVHHLVVKVTPKVDETTYQNCQFVDLFTNEINAYTDVFNTLQWYTTKYYFSYNKPMSACIVLRDFSHDGFKMCKHMINLPLEYVIVAMKELGRFHGYSYAIKESDPNQFQKITSLFKESRYSSDEGNSEVWKMMSREGPKRAINLVRKSSSVPESFLKKLENLYEKPLRFQKKLVQPIEPLAIICHGDYLRNNIAFKYNEETPIKALIFDFQTLRYSSPMVDVTTFLCNSTGFEVRTRHFDNIFNAYHNTVIEALCEKLGKDESLLPEYYSRSSFLQEYTKMLPYGIGIAGSFLSILHDPSDKSDYDLFTMEDNVEKAKGFFLEKFGENVDEELKSLIHHLYDLMLKLGLELE